MSSSVCSWCSSTKWERWVNLRFYLFIFGINQVEQGREVIPRFPVVTPVVWELPLRPITSVWSVCRWLANGGWFLFCCRWMMGVGFENTCIGSGKWNVSRVISRLCGWVNKTLRLSPLTVEHSVIGMTADNQDYPRLNPMGSQFSIPISWNLCSESVGA